ncbi:Putative aminoglycoside phosphotransferase (fragment) [Frankia canadensis]|uniref:Aminoglycoside phosphotransferase n=1 Tax=Frankia canadensis TaxID=1836972 RepID=A0A2I2KSM4_9ACTN
MARWERLIATVPDDLRDGAAECAALLRASAPPPLPPVILHGDYRLGNLLAEGSEVTGIVDWEIWSLGDPRIDVAWFLMWAADAGMPLAVRAAAGWPDTAELRAAYERASGTALPGLDWFAALSRFKQAATVAAIVKHRRRAGPDPEVESAARAVPAMTAAALRLLRG